MKLRPRILIAAALIPSSALGLLLAASLFFSEQADAVRGLRQAAADGLTRGVPFPNAPSYAFADFSRAPWRELVGPEYAHAVTGVAFDHYDDRQLLDSIVHLQRLTRLERIVLSGQPAADVLAQLQAALPGVEFVVRPAPAP